jgi:uncharacterized protein (TIGR03083 family)
MSQTSAMDPDRYLEVIRTEAAALASAGRQGLTEPVATCPGWSVQDLIAHTGAVHGWVTAKLEDVPGLTVHRGGWSPPPPDDGDWAAWLEAIAGRLVDALAAADPGRTLDTWAGVQPVAFWHRRMAQETTVHRWDGEAAVSQASPIAADVAVDGIDELFSLFLPLRVDRRALAADPPWVMALETLDGGAAWRLELEPVGVSIVDSGGESDLAVQGTASDLLLWLWNRRGADDLTLHGDAALAERWRHVLQV